MERVLNLILESKDKREFSSWLQLQEMSILLFQDQELRIRITIELIRMYRMILWFLEEIKIDNYFNYYYIIIRNYIFLSLFRYFY